MKNIERDSPHQLRIDDAIHGLMLVTRRTVSLIAWLLVFVVHLAVLVLVLVALWWFQLAPTDLQALVQAVSLGSPAATIFGIAGFLGISGWALFHAYAKAWKWLSERLAKLYVLNFG